MSDFYTINKGEAYSKSQYMFQEQLLASFFTAQLINLGYVSQEPTGRVWTKESKKVIVCLSDDIFTFGTNSATPVDHVLDQHTTVITDNTVLGITKYNILKLPDSYFGIYSYTPECREWAPDKRFNFSVNRFDRQRLLIFLELINQTGGLSELLLQDYINFNVFVPDGENTKIENIQHNFLKIWNDVDKNTRPLFKIFVDQLVDKIPLRNHTVTHEQAHVNAWLNVVVESYAGDINRTVSEKTFRALVTPVPWTLYACRYTVELLKTLGFDVLEDVVDHSYNKILQCTTPDGIGKIQQFIAASIENQQRIENMEFDTVKSRCQKAAEHNRKLLADMRKQWPVDFANWLPSVIKQLA